jgi:hypothetical protein
MESISQLFKFSSPRLPENLFIFQIFQLVITKRHQRNEYNLSQFFSELGGSTGLVLGIRFLTRSLNNVQVKIVFCQSFDSWTTAFLL